MIRGPMPTRAAAVFASSLALPYASTPQLPDDQGERPLTGRILIVKRPEHVLASGLS